MKKFTLILAALLVALIPLSAQAKKQADISFAETTYNFGTIPENKGKVTHTFHFTNTGEANLMIIDAKADCGCTVPEYPKEPIAPGKKGIIRVTFDPKYRPGAFNKVITIRSNAKHKKVRLKINGTVNPNK